MSTATPNQIETPVSRRGTPTWEMALQYPNQGDWREHEYLMLDTGRLIEFTDGVLEFLPMPKLPHQRILLFLNDSLRQYVIANSLGEVLVSPSPVRIRPGKFREPDIFVIRPEHIDESDGVPTGADLVVEVVSEGQEARDRDLIKKRKDYAEAGIPEYWIVDLETSTVTVLTLDEKEYRTHGEFHPGHTADSVLLDGFTVDVRAVFDAGKSPTK